MSSWRWKVRRLRAMSLHEIATRALRAIRERLAPLPKEPPEATWQRYGFNAPQWLEALVQQLSLHPHAMPDAERERLISEANALMQGKWTLFGYPVQLDDPPCWNRNYLLGKDWIEAPAKQVDYRRNDIAGGVKYVWELSRHQPLLRLAQAYALTGDPRYAEKCLAWWLDWIKRNPRGWGIHWTSALEHAIRVLVWFY
ncbi:MAG: heparinase, partial [Armatimonadetes bacterium]|nr:heparinase [Armatimonadota bacterium]